MAEQKKRSRAIGNLSILSGIVVIVANSICWSILLYQKMLYEALHPGLVVDPLFPSFSGIRIILILIGAILRYQARH